MKTFKLHLIRHGLTAGNLQGLYIGSGTDIPLCDEGRAQLAELKEKPVEVAVETVVDPEAIEKARAEAVAEMQEKLDKAREAKAKADERRKQAEASVEILKKSIDEMERKEKKAALGADKDLAQFEVLFDQTKETVNRMHGILIKVRSRDEDAAGRLSKALAALAEAVRRCAE